MNTSEVQKFGGSETNQKTIFEHPSGLFVLFFTEMWERFSYYGMRILLVLFLITEATEGGMGWTRQESAILFGWYAMLVYITPIVGGWIADTKIGHRNAVALGALIMTLGHGSMALEMWAPVTFFLGLLLLIIGTGFFKPNISSIISGMYPKNSSRKDGAFTIFYMGVNSGAFLGILLVGYIGEKVNWSYGFGLAGIFMLFGLLQFWFGQKIFGDIGTKPVKGFKKEVSEEEKDNLVPFTKTDSIFLYLGIPFAVLWIINGLYYVVTRGSELFDWSLNIGSYALDLNEIFLIVSVFSFIYLIVSRLKRYTKIERDRLIVIATLGFFVIFFWASFEQAATSLNIFAKDYTNRVVSGNYAVLYKVIDAGLSIIPLIILSWIIFKLAKNIVSKFPLTITFITISFTIIWIISIWRLRQIYSEETTEIAVSWFQILNSFFIISLAPLFSKIWKKYPIPGPFKFAIGLTLLGIGFGALAYGSLAIPAGAKTASVSMIWLIFAFFFHTVGELSIAPVGLSYVSKLAPARLIGLMFGIWYIFISLANKIAASTASQIDPIADKFGLSGFFSIFLFGAIGAAFVLVLMSKTLRKMMHGIE